jgi:hypothetical protein
MKLGAMTAAKKQLGMREIEVFPFQCSKVSTPAAVKEKFLAAIKHQALNRVNGAETCISLVFLDELSM